MAAGSAIEADIARQQGLRNDVYEQAAMTASNIPVVFMDPNQLTGDEFHDAITIEAQLEVQAPGITSEASYEDMVELATLSRMKGPFATSSVEHNGAPICIINRPDVTEDERHEIAALIAKRPADQIGHVPGSDEGTIVIRPMLSRMSWVKKFVWCRGLRRSPMSFL